MWTANAATVIAEADSGDGRLHLVTANLSSMLHRAVEAEDTHRRLSAVFADPARFQVHPPLPRGVQFGDEGAANHTRLVTDDDSPGVEFFVHGQVAFDARAARPTRFPARQTLESQVAIARRHGLAERLTVHAQQRPEAIDAGVFHNDVIAVGSGPLLFCHDEAFVDQAAVLAKLATAIGPSFTPVGVAAADVSVADAVATYLFNSQLLRRPDGRFLLVAPMECRENPATARYLDRLLAGGGPIAEVIAFDLRQSMRNGGGPACLRLRVALTDAERSAVAARVFADGALLDALETWVRRHYRDRLSPADLADPALLDESRRALDELSTLLRLGSVYDFQG